MITKKYFFYKTKGNKKQNSKIKFEISLENVRSVFYAGFN